MREKKYIVNHTSYLAKLLGLIIILKCSIIIGDEMNHEMGDPQKVLTFNYSTKTIHLGVTDLENIREAMIKFLNNPSDSYLELYGEFREQLLKEFELLPCWISETEKGHVGRWILEKHDNKFAIVRQPLRSEIMYTFYFILDLSNRSWNIENFGHQKQYAR